MLIFLFKKGKYMQSWIQRWIQSSLQNVTVNNGPRILKYSTLSIKQVGIVVCSMDHCIRHTGIQFMRHAVLRHTSPLLAKLPTPPTCTFGSVMGRRSAPKCRMPTGVCVLQACVNRLPAERKSIMSY